MKPCTIVKAYCIQIYIQPEAGGYKFAKMEETFFGHSLVSQSFRLTFLKAQTKVDLESILSL